MDILHLTETQEQMDVFAEKRMRVPVIPPQQTKRKNTQKKGAAPSRRSTVPGTSGQNGNVATPSCSKVAAHSGSTVVVPVEADLFWDCMDEEWAAGDMGPEVLTSRLQHADIVIGSSRDDRKVYAGFAVWLERDLGQPPAGTN